MKVAVVGTGSVGRRHLGNLVKLGIDDIFAVSVLTKRETLVLDGVEIKTVHNMEDAFQLRPDAVVIANPTSLHLDCLSRAVSKGCHIYLEKPASVSATGLKEIEVAASKRGLVIAVGTMYRFNKRLMTLKQRVDNGDLGKILYVQSVIGEHIADYHPEEDYRTSYTARAELGGGVLLTQIHQIDWLNWIFGPFETVSASGGHVSDLEIDVEDCATYLLRSADGTPAFGHLNYLQRPKQAGLTVTGTAGQLEWNLFENSLTMTKSANDAKAETTRSTYDRNAMFLDAMEDFLLSIKNNSRPRSTLKDGRQALLIVDAIKDSMNSQHSESIPR